MSETASEWLGPADGPPEPTLLPISIEPSPAGADDTARLLGIAVFNGLCRLVAALADRRLLLPEELQGLEDAMTTPLDDPEWRDDEVISSFRDTTTEILGMALTRTL